MYWLINVLDGQMNGCENIQLLPKSNIVKQSEIKNKNLVVNDVQQLMCSNPSKILPN